VNGAAQGGLRPSEEARERVGCEQGTRPVFLYFCTLPAWARLAEPPRFVGHDQGVSRRVCPAGAAPRGFLGPRVFLADNERMAPRAPLALAAAILFAVPACADGLGQGDAQAPGTQLGTFHVTASRTENTCGEGALGTQPTWTFDVKLARDPGALYWNNGADLIRGELDADAMTFHFTAAVETNMRAGATPSLPPCSVRRNDQAKGVLDAKDANAHAFTGSLSYDFAPTSGSSCADLVSGEMAILAALPCRFAYKLAAEKKPVPSP
jgi:hypothetical protein